MKWFLDNELRFAFVYFSTDDIWGMAKTVTIVELTVPIEQYLPDQIFLCISFYALQLLHQQAASHANYS